MDLQAKKDELQEAHTQFSEQMRVASINIQRIEGALSIINEQLAETPEAVSPNGKVKEKIEA